MWLDGETPGLRSSYALGLAGVFFLGVFFLGCQAPHDAGPHDAPTPAGWVDAERLLAADDEPQSWLALGRDFGEQHYSPLDLINVDNVQQLGLAWEYDARTRRGTTHRGQEATPIVVDGVLYTSAAWSVVHALDAKTGSEIWRYDPQVDGAFNRKVCCDVVNRGVAVWKGRVYVATLDGYLVALDAASGDVAWKVDTLVDRSRSYTITAAPRIAGDKVVIGNSGAEFGVRGYFTAYDAASGDFAWRFFTVPGDPKKGFEHPEMEQAAATWDPESHWESGGGGTVWGDMAYDPNLNLLYVGTGNASPYPIWFRSPSGGDNLFLASILAIDPDTGRLVWHYQTTPAEIWDYTATQHMILADLELDGVVRQVLMQAPKNGFFYVLDRRTGELLSAEKFVTVNWASHVDLATGRPVATEQGDYREGPKLVYPSASGAHSWQPMSYSPLTGLVYIPAQDAPMLMLPQEDYEYRPGEFNIATDYAYPPFEEGFEPFIKDHEIRNQKMLIAWDPVTQQEVWHAPPAPGLDDGGVLSTAGNLVFQGTASGHFVVFRADTGEKLKEIEVGTGIMAGATTYVLDGEQYVAVMAGFGGADLASYPQGAAALTYENSGRILAFKLGGGAVPLPPRLATPEIPEPPDLPASPAILEAGAELYLRHCMRCHAGFGDEHTSGYPDLTLMTPETYQAFDAIVLEGALSYGGMASFSDVLDEVGSKAIRSYIAAEQRGLASRQAP